MMSEPKLNDKYEQTRIKDLCGLYNVQNCHLCDDINCGDNLKWRRKMAVEQGQG